MAIFSLELTALEVTTRKLFNEALEGDKWSANRLMIAKVFVGAYGESISLNDICNRLCSNEGLIRVAGFDDRIKDELTRYVRDGVLRSRLIRGVRHWEVNY